MGARGCRGTYRAREGRVPAQGVREEVDRQHARGWTIGQIADEGGLPQATVQNLWHGGVRNLPASDAEALRAALARLAGRCPARCPAGPTRAVVLELRRRGASCREIAQAAGASVQWVWDLSHGRYGTVPVGRTRAVGRMASEMAGGQR